MTQRAANAMERVEAGQRSGVMRLPGWAWERLTARLSHPRLGLHLALIAILLSSSALLLGFYLDDYTGRYIYSDREGAARLYENYSGGYGLAIGDPAENHWQMEAGWAPWWHYEKLRIALYRPIGVLVHTLDFRLWPDNARIMHAHNLLWLGLMVVAMTFMYRVALGGLLGGAAAFLFAIDHTHGFAVGHICNRHALMGPLFGALAIAFHIRYRRGAGARAGLLAPLFYVLGLLTSESAIAVAGYIVAYELLAEAGALKTRALSAAPYALITVVWRALYNRAGYGAFGSGVYTDMGREPLAYARALLERGPVLWVGQFLAPPAEVFGMVPDEVERWLIGWAFVVVALSAWTFFPLLRRDRMARFWALGMLGSLVPAAAVIPHNRQLVFASIGAMALLAQLWKLYAEGSVHRVLQRPSAYFGLLLLGCHVIGGPLWLPLTTTSIALTKPVHVAAASVGDEVAGRDLIFVTTPDFYTVRLVQLMKRIDGAPLPRRIRALSGVPAEEPAPITVSRSGERALEVHFPGGLLQPPSSDLHRDRSIPMPAGSRVSLEGFEVEVLRATPQGWPEHVRFTFDKPLEDPQLAFYRWDERRFVPFQPPAIGERVELPGAKFPLK